MVDWVGVAVGLGLLLLGIVFGWGRRTGRAAGRREGLDEAPLTLRRLSLEQGQCQLCGHQPAEPPDVTDGGKAGDEGSDGGRLPKPSSGSLFGPPPAPHPTEPSPTDP